MNWKIVVEENMLMFFKIKSYFGAKIKCQLW